MNMPIKLNQPLIDPKTRQRSLLEIAYWRASERVDGGYFTTKTPDGNNVLTRFNCEEDKDYAERLRITPRRNYIRRFAARYNQAVFRHDPMRGDTFTDQRLRANADGMGTPIDKLMASALLSAQIGGRAALVLYEGANTDDVVETQAQASEIGTQQYMFVAHAEDILHVGRDGDTVIEVVILVTPTLARLYTDMYTRDVEVDGKLVVKSVGEEVPHYLGSVPVSVIEPFVGSSQVASWADHQRTITTLKSQEALEITNHTFTRWIVSGVRAGGQQGAVDELPDNVPAGDRANTKQQSISWGSRRMWSFEDENVKVERLGSDVSQADSIRASITNEEEALYRDAGLSANFKLDGAPQSGVSRIIQLEDFVLQAGQLTDAIEQAERHIVELIALADASDYTPVVYTRDYMESGLELELARLRSALELLDMLPADQDFIEEHKRDLITKFMRKHYDMEAPTASR